MKRFAAVAVLLAGAWLGCAQSRTRIVAEDGESFMKYHHIGIPSFVDKQGKGKAIADDLTTALTGRLYNEPIDRVALEQILGKYKIDRDTGLGVEALEEIRGKTSADALVLGSMAPDWSSARVTMLETEMGGPVLRAIILPRRGKKVFATTKEVVEEIVRAFSRAQ